MEADRIQNHLLLILPNHHQSEKRLPSYRPRAPFCYVCNYISISFLPANFPTVQMTQRFLYHRSSQMCRPCCLIGPCNFLSRDQDAWRPRLRAVSVLHCQASIYAGSTKPASSSTHTCQQLSQLQVGSNPQAWYLQLCNPANVTDCVVFTLTQWRRCRVHTGPVGATVTFAAAGFNLGRPRAASAESQAECRDATQDSERLCSRRSVWADSLSSGLCCAYRKKKIQKLKKPFSPGSSVSRVLTHHWQPPVPPEPAGMLPCPPLHDIPPPPTSIHPVLRAKHVCALDPPR